MGVKVYAAYMHLCCAEHGALGTGVWQDCAVPLRFRTTAALAAPACPAAFRITLARTGGTALSRQHAYTKEGLLVTARADPTLAMHKRLAGIT